MFLGVIALVPIAWEYIDTPFITAQPAARLQTTREPGAGTLDRYDFSRPRLVELPNVLREISGLAVTDDDRVFAHNDEKGIIYQIRLNDGSILKRFQVGRPAIREDFEDIAIRDQTFHLVTSSGRLYRFQEGEDWWNVPYTMIETGLTARQNVEGLCFNPDSQELLLACKGEPIREQSGKAFYTYNLRRSELSEKPRFLLEISRQFSPSGMARHPQSGTYFIISARDRRIVEIDSSGRVRSSRQFTKHEHPQMEGIGFLSDGTLLISDEGRSGPGSITLYSYRAAYMKDRK